MSKRKVDKKENLLFSGWALSVIATLGSLYFSEIKQYEPCELCWIQRIFMYPLVIVLGIAYVRKDYHAARYAIALSGIGMLVSLYHFLIQKVPAFASSTPACGLVPCNGQYINWLGFITIPFLALIAFIGIFLASFMILKHSKEDKQ